MNKYLIEFIGTFFLVLVVSTAAVVGTAGDFAPFAIAGVLMAMIYAGGHISGAHYNPAVTLGAFLRGALPPKEVAPYMISQILGAVIGSLIGMKILGAGTGVTAFQPEVLPALVAEFLFTFALVFTVLNVATAKSTEGNSYFGFAIGLVVLVGAFTVGGISLGAFNPAVTIGLIVAGKLSIASVWIYLLAQFAAGVAAAFAFKFVASES